MGCVSTIRGQSGYEYVLAGVWWTLNRGLPLHERQYTKFNIDILLILAIGLVYRLNTYPLIHIGFLHALLNTIALAPLLERFEADHGTLLTAAMFVGRESMPAIMG